MHPTFMEHKPSRFGLLINPEAGKIVDVARMESVLGALLRRGGADCVSHVSKSGEDLGVAAKGMVEAGCDAIAVAGGDGSINQVLPVLVGCPIALGVLPLGTINLLSLELGIPRNAQQAVQILLAGKTKRIDAGSANGRYFLQVAGAGWDASVMSRFKTRRHKQWIALLLPFVAAAVSRSMPAQAWRISCDGQVSCVKGRGVVIANGSMYAGPYCLSPEVLHDDGKLDLFVVPEIPVGEFLRFVAAITTGAPIHSGMKRLQGARITIEPDQEVPAHADGEVCLRTPLEISVLPRAVRVFIP